MKTKLIIFYFLFLSAIPGFSQNSFRSTGTTELGGELGFTSQSVSDGGSTTTFSSSVFIGIMASTGFEIGFRPGFSISSNSSNSYNIYNLYLNPVYNFNSSTNVYPYLGFIIGHNSIHYDSQNSSDNIGGLGVGFDGGLKINLRGNSLLLVKVEFLSQHFSADSNSLNLSSNEVTLKTTSIGLGYRLFLTKAVAVKK